MVRWMVRWMDDGCMDGWMMIVCEGTGIRSA